MLIESENCKNVDFYDNKKHDCPKRNKLVFSTY